ncbi:hypothetical protein BH09CHL1_BH09CHL1_05600 [soil metagenome]
MSAVSGTPNEQGMSRMVRVGGSLLVAIILVFSAWWVAGREGLSDMGNGGADASVLPSVGDAAPDFTVPDPLGTMHSLSDYKGQPVWLNFWGSWCPPCRAEMPELVAAYQQLKTRGIVMLAISVDEPADVAQKYATQNGATFTILSDPTRSYTGADYGILNFPTHIFIDREGNIHRIALKNLSYDEAIKYAEEIINS